MSQHLVVEQRHLLDTSLDTFKYSMADKYIVSKLNEVPQHFPAQICHVVVVFVDLVESE
jgi:hypothetical protein